MERAGLLMVDGKESQRQADTVDEQRRTVSLGEESQPRHATCPNCSCFNETDARYCEDCGASMHALSACERCGAAVRPGADICEGCGAWLLRSQCVFCYAPVDEGDSYCGACGNRKDGVTCPGCGSLVIFDFCPSCGIALTPTANASQEEAVRDPGLQVLAALYADLRLSIPEAAAATSSLASDTAAAKPEDEQLAMMRLLRASLAESTQLRVPLQAKHKLLNHVQQANVARLQDDVSAEMDRRERIRQEEARRQQEAQRRRQELIQRARDELARHSGRTFNDNQEARRFFMSLIAALPEELSDELMQRGMGWRCNAYNCVHDAPHQCADPSQGGVWIIS
jgi:hypothetical protein